MQGTPVIELENVSKTFAMNGVTACNDVSLTANAGETLVLMGENGAGKSTLASLMSGVLKPDRGTIRFGESGPAALVHQKPSFGRNISVSDMVFGGNRRIGGGFFYSVKKEREKLSAVLSHLGAVFSAHSLMGDLVPYQHQMVELAECLMENKRLIILDEPEFPRLAELLELLKKGGLTPVLITHKIQDALLFGTRVIVMSKGRVVLDEKQGSKGLKENILKALMAHKSSDPVLSGLGTESRKEGIIRVIAGYHESGLWDEENLLASRMGRGENGYIPSVNRNRAMESNWSPVDNLMIHHRQKYKTSLGFLRRRRYMDDGYRDLEKNGIVARPQDLMKHLSGGNQKKLLLLREFQRPGDKILLSEPSTALDLANREYLYGLMRKAKEEGKEITLLTADPEEALAQGDEIIPLFNGKRGTPFKKGECTLDQLTALMGGVDYEKNT